MCRAGQVIALPFVSARLSRSCPVTASGLAAPGEVTVFEMRTNAFVTARTPGPMGPPAVSRISAQSHDMVSGPLRSRRSAVG